MVNQINNCMKCVVALCSLKADREKSNTNKLTEYFVSLMEDQGVECEVFYLAEQHKNFDLGVDVNNNNGEPDAMTALMQSVISADMFVIATPIWWGLHSSLAQSVVERFTYFDDWAITNNLNAMYGKTFGVIVTGANDGVQHIMGNLYNFANNLGFTIPPDAYTSYLGDGGDDILQDQETVDTTRRFARNLYLWSKLIVESNIKFDSQKDTIKRSGEIAADSLRDQQMVSQNQS